MHYNSFIDFRRFFTRIWGLRRRIKRTIGVALVFRVCYNKIVVFFNSKHPTKPVMKGGNAYRLHYWHSEGEYVLSDVAPKNVRPKPCSIDEEVIAQIHRDV